MRLRSERGATGLEWSGMVIVAALVVGSIFVAVTDSGVEAKVSCTVGNLFSGQSGGCASAGSGTSASGQPSDEGSGADDDVDRRDTQRDARGDRRDDARGDRPDEGDSSSGDVPEGGTSGGEPYPGGLGPGVPGTSAGDPPEPPAWTPPDEGAGTHASEDASLTDRATEVAAEVAANAMAGEWPDASRNLLHFLGNSGEPLSQDVDGMLAESPGFAQAVSTQTDRLGASAVEQARAAGATGPVTYPINTAWQGHYLANPQNWFLALGGIAYNQTGSVTVTPPSTPDGPWTYTVSTNVNIRDRYNWDGSKSTDIGPFNVTDEQLAELHRAGLAQEFTAVGESSTQTTTGQVP